MLLIAKSFTFAAAHRLFRDDWSDEQNNEVFGKCFRLHGHNYKVTVEVGGSVDPDNGMILNYYELSNLTHNIIVDQWDHRFLNDLPEFKNLLTTAESMVHVIHEKLDPIFNGMPYYLTGLMVQETDRTYAKWMR